MKVHLSLVDQSQDRFVSPNLDGAGDPSLYNSIELSAGKSYQLQCAVWGARPNAPTVTWYKGDGVVRVFSLIIMFRIKNGSFKNGY